MSFESTRFFLSYSTANERAAFGIDFLNFRYLSRLDPGVPAVEMYVAVSEAVPRRKSDARRVDHLAALVERNPRIRVRSTTFKSNVGREFSSAEVNLSMIARHARGGDYLLFLNRSARGPLSAGWYDRFVTQFKRFPETGLCGSTINFHGLYRPASEGMFTHVQTYAYLSRMDRLAELVDAFPGREETERLQCIEIGEIGLSRHFLDRGCSLTCLAWPEHRFTLERSRHTSLPQENVSFNAEGVPFRHWNRRDLHLAHCSPALAWWSLKGAFPERLGGMGG